jgi:hypothetical protein
LLKLDTEANFGNIDLADIKRVKQLRSVEGRDTRLVGPGDLKPAITRFFRALANCGRASSQRRAPRDRSTQH